jgi:5-methylcytosine-specific restriction endonuclease McrA
MKVKGRKVLVLNADYQALTVCSVYKAFILLFLDKAEMVEPAKDFMLNTVDESYEAPSVIRLSNYVNVPYRGVMLTRYNVFKRDGNACVYCGSTKDLTLDHVIPSSRGGKTSWSNLVTACKVCNGKKGDRTLEEAELSLPYAPFKPSFVLFLREYSNLSDQKWLPFLGAKGYQHSY